MKKIKITIKLSRQEKIKTLKRLSRATVGQPRPGKTIRPKKGGPYRRRVKHRKPLTADD
jgi:hypothetical protein